MYWGSEAYRMERIHIAIRLVLTIILFSGLVTTSQRVGAKLASYTAPSAPVVPDAVVQGRRTVMDQLATARVLAQHDQGQAETLLLQILTHARDPQMRERASTLLVGLAQPSWPADYRQGFLETIAAGALMAARDHQVPPSIILAQAILESGWGRSALATKHNNLFGVKSTQGANSVAYPTLEYGTRGVQIVTARFRSYGSVAEALKDHGELLSQDERYANAMTHNGNWRQFLADLAPTYASDPGYSGQITQIISRYDLDRWDRLTDSSGLTGTRS
jgi:lysozyme